MIRTTLRIIVSCLTILSTTCSFGQGCSDAGFCTINTFKPNSSDSTKTTSHQLKAGIFYGDADNSIFVYGGYLEYNRQINRTVGVDIKVTSIAQDGNGISVFGLSDLFLNANFQATEKIKLTLGTKIPLSSSNKMLNSLPLPMDYQPSLGTVDLIAGIGYDLSKLQLVAAIQQPLTQNKNEFLASAYPANSKIREFQSTNRFKRSGDILLRASYPIPISNKIKVTPSTLPIYHLSKDKYTDEQNVERVINGSQGLTLNGNAYVDYQLGSNSTLQLNVGMPFIVRDVRPDGLTRSFIANIEYRFRF